VKRIKEEAEVIVRLDYMEQLAHICVHAWPAMAAKMEKRYGPSMDGSSESSRRWRVSLRVIRFGTLEKRKRSLKTPVLPQPAPPEPGPAR